MPKIIMLRGNSGSGKSTVAKALQEKLGRGTLLVSQDDVRREMLWVRGGPDSKSIDLLKHLVLFGYKHCAFTILEGILYADDHKELFRKIEEMFGDQAFAYYFDLPFEETLKRHEQKLKRNEWGELEMRKWWREKDVLANICEKMIYKETSLDETVERILNDIQFE